MSEQNDSSQNAEQTTPNTITAPEGQSHAHKIWLQLDDGNCVYELVQKTANQDSDPNKNRPYPVGAVDEDIMSSTPDIGLFKKGVQYGYTEGGTYSQSSALVLNQYDDIEKHRDDSEAKTISNDPRTVRIEYHIRDTELTYKDGNSYSWPRGRRTNTQYEGTAIKIETSNCNSTEEAISRAINVIECSDLPDEIVDTFQNKRILETTQQAVLESYHRIHRRHRLDLMETLKDSCDLIFSADDGLDGSFSDENEKTLYGFSTANIDELGFDTTMSHNDTEIEIDKVLLKVYMHPLANQFNETNPLAHPKVEIKALGAFPPDAYDKVKRKLDEILNAHIFDFCGINTDDLIPDEFYDGIDQPQITTESPSEYRKQLQELYESDIFQSEVLKFLYRGTNTPKDILFILTQIDNFKEKTYKHLKEKTGSAIGTIRKWVGRFVDAGLCKKVHDHCVFIELAPNVREIVRKFTKVGKPIGDIKEEIKKRKQERIKKRMTAEERKQQRIRERSNETTDEGIQCASSSEHRIAEETTQQQQSTKPNQMSKPSGGVPKDNIG